jgi:hypothetical protein
MIALVEPKMSTLVFTNHMSICRNGAGKTTKSHALSLKQRPVLSLTNQGRKETSKTGLS